MRRLGVLVLALGAVGCRSCFGNDLEKLAAPFPCDPFDAGPMKNLLDHPQCYGDWRCGLERVCHPRDAGAYRCDNDDDSWCEEDWECGPEGVCVPPVFDGFRSDNASELAVSTERIPQALDRMPDFVAVAPEEGFVPGLNLSAVSYISGGQFVALGRARSGPPGDPITGNYVSNIFTCPAPAGVKALGASITGSVMPFVLTDAGVSYIYVDKFDAGLATAIVTPLAWTGIAGEQLRIVPAPVPYSVVFGGSGAGVALLGYPPIDALFQPGSPPTFFSRYDVWPFKVTPTRDAGIAYSPVIDVVDMTAVADDNDGGRTMLIASIDDQLSIGERHGPDFQQIVVFPDGGYARYPYTGGFDGGLFWGLAQVIPSMGGANGFFPLEVVAGAGYPYSGGFFTPKRLRSYQQRVAVETAGPVPKVALMHAAYTALPGTADEYPFLLMLLEPCEACPKDGAYELVDFRPFGLDQPRIEARCRNRADAGEVTRFLQTPVGGQGCAVESVFATTAGTLRDSVKPSTALVGRGGWAGAHGQLWSGDSLSQAVPLFVDGPPKALATSRFFAGALAAIDYRTFYFLTDAGFAAGQGASAEFAPVASVIGRDDWVVIANGSVGRQAPPSAEQVIAEIRTPDLALIHEPFFGEVARDGKGGLVLVTTANDAIFSADVSVFERGDLHDHVELEFRTVPLTRVPIRSLAVLDPVGQSRDGGPDDAGAVFSGADGGPYTRGYVLARAELLEFVAETKDRWVTRKLAVPPGEAVEVWSDEDRARLGMSDGRVYSLPAFKPLSGPFEDAGFFDFYGFQHQAWALNKDAVWRLKAQSDGGGSWGALPDVGVGTLAGGRLYSAYGSLWLFTATGAVVRLTAAAQ